jgi:hypothetical protein
MRKYPRKYVITGPDGQTQRLSDSPYYDAKKQTLNEEELKRAISNGWMVEKKRAPYELVTHVFSEEEEDFTAG